VTPLAGLTSALDVQAEAPAQIHWILTMVEEWNSGAIHPYARAWDALQDQRTISPQDATVVASSGFAADEISAMPKLIIGSGVEGDHAEFGPGRAAKGSTVNVTLDAQEVAEAMWELEVRRLVPVPG